MNNSSRITRRRFLKHSSASLVVGVVTGAAIESLAGCHRDEATTTPNPTAAGAADGGSAGTPRFSDMTAAANLDFVQSNGTCERRYFCEQVAAGAALFDANGDGFLDIYFPQPKPLGVCKKAYPTPLRHRLYINDGKGRFTLKEDAFGGVETDYGIAAAVGDYNNDGHADLYVCCYGTDRLFRNRGDGTFEDVTEKAGVGVKGFSTGAVWFDYDGDGYLDLFVCRYADWTVEKDDPCFNTDGKPEVCSPVHYPPSLSVLFHNNGDGTFTDVTHQSGLGSMPNRSLGVAAADFHNKGRLDLFVANDQGANFLLSNMGGGKFKDVARVEGVAMGQKSDPQANMGVAVGDYDEDGDLDIVVTTFSGEPYTVYRNENCKYFTDVSMETGIATPTLPMLGFGTFFFDSRNIGRLDLFFANGHINPYIESVDPTTRWKQPNQLMLNDGSGKFDWCKEALPAADVRVHKGACFGDIDNDGRVDILVSAENDRPTLLHNDSPQKNWLMLQLTNKHGCCTPIGTRCIATIEGKEKLRVVLGGGSYGGDSDFRVHYGLGDAKFVEKIEIHWLSGARQTLVKVAANQILKVKEQGTK